MLKLIKWSGIITTVLLLPVAYIVAHETLTIVLPPVLYVAGAVTILALILGVIGAVTVGLAIVRTRVAELGSLRVIAAANAQMALAEAENKKIMVIRAPREDQLVIKAPPEDYFRQMHLAPQSHVNGIAAPVTPEQITIYRDYHGRRAAANEPLMIDAPEVDKPDINIDDIIYQYGPEWIQSLVLPAPHVHYCGATQSGKTTLANHHIEWIARQEPATKFYLLNPKDTASRKPFIINSNYKDIGDALEGLTHFNEVMIKRKNDQTLRRDANKIVFVIDEWDWIFRVHKWEAVGLLEPLIKVGAELKIQVILIGQSPLTGDTGLSQSLYYNMVRVAIGQEGVRLIKNYSVENESRKVLFAEYNAIRKAAPLYKLRYKDDLRYCVAVPMGGNPSVQVIPFLTDPDPIKQAVIERPIPTAEEKVILRAWWAMKDQEKIVATELHWTIRPDLSSKPSKQQLDKYRDVIKKFGYDPKF